MAPKRPNPTDSSSVFIVSSGALGIESAFATRVSANKRAAELAGGTVTVLELIGGVVSTLGGRVNVLESGSDKKEVKNKIKRELEEDNNDNLAVNNTNRSGNDSGTSNTESIMAAKKTKSPQEQIAANKKKPSNSDDADMPANFKSLLKGTGTIFDGQSIVVTGVPPVLGRKNADKLVVLYGGHLTKSISRKTSFVVLGNDAGPTKLEKIEEFCLKVYKDTEFVDFIEKELEEARQRVRTDDDDRESEEKVLQPKRRAIKRQKK